MIAHAPSAAPGALPGPTVRLPYARPWLDAQDLSGMAAVLASQWLTTGPVVEQFESAFARAVGARFAVAVSSGTAALHAALAAAGVGPGHEVILPAMTFVATANAAIYLGALPVVVDVEADTLQIDAHRAAAAITPRTRAIVAVDYGGLPCDYRALAALARRHGLTLVADACHSLGGSLAGRPVGSLADLSAFSFHPVKHITTGEGGMVTTDDPALAERLRRFRNHGIDLDHHQRAQADTPDYEMVELGYNYRLSDLACALGLSQLEKLAGFVARRRELAAEYDWALAGLPLAPVARRPGAEHAYHLYVVRLAAGVDRAQVWRAMKAEGIGTNVHYLPVHQHAFYRRRYPGAARRGCPVAERAYHEILSLPMFPAMTRRDVQDVAAALRKALGVARRAA